MQQHFESLKVWQVAMHLVEEAYLASAKFPQTEQYGLTSQLRRAAVSIPSNIAEGKGRNHKKEVIQFLYTAKGSSYEAMTLLQVCQRLKYLPKDKTEYLLSLLSEITAMLNGLIHSLE